MFTRFVQFEIKAEKKDEFVRFTKKEILPILTKQPGFMELLPFAPESHTDRNFFSYTLWNKKTDAERFERDVYPKIAEMIKPYIASTPVVKYYNLETSLLCREFAHAFTA